MRDNNRGKNTGGKSIIHRDTSWRRVRIRESAQSRRAGGGIPLRRALEILLALELLVGAGQIWESGGIDFRFLRQEEECAVEWAVPGESPEGENGEIYGVRLKPDTLEIQFYHRRQESRLQNKTITNH